MAPQLTVRKNGGAAQTGAITCAYSDSIRLRLASPGSVRSCRFEIYGYPSGWSAPSGWTEDTEARVIYATTTEPSDFTLPASATWGKWLLRAIVDGETDDGVTALEIVSSAGIHATPAGESTQFGGAAQSWGRDLEVNWRTLETALAGAGASLAGDVTGLAGANTVANIQGVIVDFEGDPEPVENAPMTLRWIAGTPRFVFQKTFTPVVFYDQGRTASPPYDNLHYPIFATWSEAYDAANALAQSYGVCELMVLNRTTSTPQITAGTWDMDNIVLRGKNTDGGRVTLSLAPGVQFRNPYRFENLTIENDQTAPLFEAPSGRALGLTLVDCDLSDVGMTDLWATAPASSSNTLRMIRSSISGPTFIDLDTTRSLVANLYSSIAGRLADGASGSSLVVYSHGASSYTTDGAYGGTLLEHWYVTGGSKVAPVAGSGSVTLTESQAATDELIFTGTLTGNRTVTLPDGVRRRTIRNDTDGAYSLRVQCGGGFTYLLPGQSRVVTVGADNVLRGEALSVMEMVLTISLAGDTVGNHATFLCALPAGCIVDRCEVVTLASPVGGRSQSSVGTNASTYDDIVAKTDTPALGVDPLGKASSTLGSAMSTDGCAFYSSATALYLNHNVTSATVTAGSVRVFVAARYLGV